MGDAIGLPREGLKAERARRLLGGPPLRHRLVLGRGLVSDDTEHACMVGQALLTAPADPRGFARSLAWRLRGWLLCLPAGVGLATLRSVGKLLLGFPPERSGVFSAGNGPAMRAALLGACLGDTPALREHLRLSTRITHTDPRAEEGALLVALAAARAAGDDPVSDPEEALAELQRGADVAGDELRAALAALAEHLRRGAEPIELAAHLGLQDGVTGYVNHTVPMSLYCWLRWPADFRAALEAVVGLGGDTDTTGAIVGGIAGAAVGADAIPQEWLGGLIEWPRSIGWMRRLASRLSFLHPEAGTLSAGAAGALPLFWPVLPVRNLVFTMVVIAHGLRRTLPPY